VGFEEGNPVISSVESGLPCSLNQGGLSSQGQWTKEDESGLSGMLYEVVLIWIPESEERSVVYVSWLTACPNSNVESWSRH
jgi:hypothetical protein